MLEPEDENGVFLHFVLNFWRGIIRGFAKEIQSTSSGSFNIAYFAKNFALAPTISKEVQNCGFPYPPKPFWNLLFPNDFGANRRKRYLAVKMTKPVV